MMINSMDKHKTATGSPFWMAPELVCEQEYTTRVDIWSLGITCIELAEIMPPYANMQTMRALFLIASPETPPPKLTHPEKCRDPLPELPTVYDKKGKPIRPKGVPPGYVPPGSNFPPIPKGTQFVNGPKGPTLLAKSTSIAKACDLQDGFADGQWFGYPIAVGEMLEAPPLDYGAPVSAAPPVQPTIYVEQPVYVQAPSVYPGAFGPGAYPPGPYGY